ncbi:hypothetical protein C8Q80DRAFT_1305697 [Daedaleopsis nitida]|nr:hypothetical protein C8Q80DRAFT_1305697 [Daedaleopsis nitida]
MTFRSTQVAAISYPSGKPEHGMPPFPVPHTDYYFDDGNLVILVENTLFRLFRSTFTRHSAVFRDLFSLPGPVGIPVDGLDDDHPLHFSGISAVEFERLLWILYPFNYGSWRAHTLDEWTSILSLATRWDFNDVRALAIRSIQALDGLSPVDKIALAHEYDVTGRWVLAAYTTLCERPEPLSIAEATRLGLETATRVAQVREQLRAGGSRSARMGGYHSLTWNAAIRHGSSGPGSGSAARATVSLKPPRAERLQWGIGRSFLEQRDIPPPVHARAAPQKCSSAKKGATAIPGTARLVAEAFGIDVSR